MSIFDRLFVGRVIKDFGPLEVGSAGIGKCRKSVLLAERRGKLKLALKWSASTWFSGSVSYFELDMASLPKLRQCMDEAERIAADRA